MVCKSCKSSFPTTIKLDGKKISLSSRSFCLSCSPFKSHNTSKAPPTERLKKELTTCIQCSRTYEYSRQKGHQRTICNSCSANRSKHLKKEKLVAHFGGECSLCGYRKNYAALQFHHTDPTLKEFAIGSKHCRSFSSLLIEASKCVLICANCHIEMHSPLRQLVVEQADL